MLFVPRNEELEGEGRHKMSWSECKSFTSDNEMTCWDKPDKPPVAQRLPVSAPLFHKRLIGNVICREWNILHTLSGYFRSFAVMISRFCCTSWGQLNTFAFILQNSSWRTLRRGKGSHKLVQGTPDQIIIPFCAFKLADSNVVRIQPNRRWFIQDIKRSRLSFNDLG